MAYVKNTRKFIEAFFSNKFYSMEQTDDVHQELSLRKEPANTYVWKHINPLKCYRFIGTAKRSVSGYNVREYTWCVRADISMAVQRLTSTERLALKARFLYGLYHEYFADAIGTTSTRDAESVLSSAIHRLAAMLDKKSVPEPFIPS